MKATRALRKLSVCTVALGLTLAAGCSGAGSLGASDNEVTIALVSNSQMTDAQKLSPEFEKANPPGIKLKFISLSENQARAKITMSTAMGGSQFDVAMISNFETPAVGQGRLASAAVGLREEHAGVRRGRLHPLAARLAVV